MSDVVIRVEGLGKRYRIGAQQASYRTLRETVVDMAHAPLRRLTSILRGQASSSPKETIWALKDVSFEVKRGEAVGIIGRNGAGKTTLLKILSRITKPTEGRVSLEGRVGSLLEVGTGFHPELTGRENIYLNGAILGMRRAEIERKFDEIVSFAEIEKFLDTPVKHYSSGMYVRLAFSVAAHLDPEILLVDEVLSVGDVEFQRKSMGKMGNAIQKEGRTILFVSHNLAAVEGLCNRTIVLGEGKLAFHGNTTSAVNYYLTGMPKQANQGMVDLTHHTGRRKGSKPVICSLRVHNDEGKETGMISVGSSVGFEVMLDPTSERYSRCSLGIGIFNLLGQLVVPFRSGIQYAKPWSLEGPRAIRLTWDNCVIAPGIYKVTIAFASMDNTVDWIDEAMELEVRFKGRPDIAIGTLDGGGIVVPQATWHIDPNEN